MPEDLSIKQKGCFIHTAVCSVQTDYLSFTHETSSPENPKALFSLSHLIL